MAGGPVPVLRAGGSIDVLVRNWDESAVARYAQQADGSFALADWFRDPQLPGYAAFPDDVTAVEDRQGRLRLYLRDAVDERLETRPSTALWAGSRWRASAPGGSRWWRRSAGSSG